MTKAVYAGSFDPFTIGHMNIAQEAAEIFQEVCVVIAANSQKRRRTHADHMQALISNALRKYPNIRVLQHNGLIADFCRENDIPYLIRGLRNTTDYMYEEDVAKINQEIHAGLRTVYLRTSNEIISSSMVWELFTNGKSVQKYLPYPEDVLGEAAHPCL